MLMWGGAVVSLLIFDSYIVFHQSSIVSLELISQFLFCKNCDTSVAAGDS